MKICPKCQTRYDVSARFCSVDSEVLVADASVLVGSTLDGIYVIEALLGEAALAASRRAVGRTTVRRRCRGLRTAGRERPARSALECGVKRRFQVRGR